MNGLEQVSKSDAKGLYHHFHLDQGGFDILAFQRVATDFLEPQVRKSYPSGRSASARTS